MKATNVIKRDHKAAEALFERFKKASHEAREAMAEKIFEALDAHEKMEDTYFYPALMDKMGDTAEFTELEQEQAELAAEVEEVRALSANRDERIKEMMEKVLIHAKKEEKEILSAADEIMSEKELEDLGEKMEPMSAVALEEKKQEEK